MALPVETFQIKTEGLPRRCEVCHQDDLFDPLSGHCGRCSALFFAPLPLLVPAGNQQADFIRGWCNGIAFVGSSLIGLFGFWILVTLWVVPLREYNVTLLLSNLGITVFFGFGYYLLYWYSRIVFGEIDSSRRRWVGLATFTYNLLIFLGLIVLLLLSEEAHWLFRLLLLGPWFSWVFLMMLYGRFLIRRERPIQPLEN